MMNIPAISALSCSLTAILVVLSPLAVFAAGTDDSIKPIRPQVQRSGIPDDSIKPVLPRLQRLSPSNEILKPVVPKQPLPAQKTKSGQNDESI